jgi:hypothetical protein
MLHQCVVFCNKLLQTIFTCTKLHSTNPNVEVGLTGEHMKICDECETVAHCTKHGCVPKQPAPTSKDEALKLALEAHQAMREWIDAVPYDTPLPAMPGCDGDWLDTVEANLKKALAQPVQPVALHAMAKRRVFDAIRGAYDLGYNDARSARAVHGDSAPGYKGRDVESDHGGALISALERYTTPPAQPEPPCKTGSQCTSKCQQCVVQEPVAWYDSESGVTDFHSFKPVRKPNSPTAEWLPLYTTPPAQPAPVKVWEAEGYDALMQEMQMVKARNIRQHAEIERLKAAQPAVPDAIGPNEDELPAYAAGWNDCRQAMLEMMK